MRVAVGFPPAVNGVIPASNQMVEVDRLIAPELLVEIEAVAIVDDGAE